ncbi:MAG: hypothetical protein J5791_05900 [Fibrobacter sp.]|nr:hypothetical protein [Fibrobacter sp.]
MNIEKRKVSQSKPLSTAAKSAIAATLGLAASFTLNACDDSSSPTSGQVVFPADSSSSEENHEPLGGDVGPEDVIPPDSSDSPETTSSSSQAEPTPESSSQVEPPASSSQVIVDIPQSHETFSSSVLEALSSSSQAVPTMEEIEKLCNNDPSAVSVEYNSLLYICPDHEGMIASMVTTFEKTDLET